MTDIKLDFEPGSTALGISILANDLESDEGLRTAFMLSLFCDRAAEPTDVLPEGVTSRRGWWADAVARVVGDKFGSRLWQLQREKETPSVLIRAQDYASESLQWSIDDKIVERLGVEVEFIRPQRGYLITTAVYRPRRDPVKFKFNRLWVAEAARI